MSKTKSQKVSPGSYWNKTGKYQYDYDRLYDLLIPAIGTPSTPPGLLLHAINKLTYEEFNNGSCNARQFESDITSNDRDTKVIGLTPFYQQFLDRLKEVPDIHVELDQIKRIMMNRDKIESYNAKTCFDVVMDAVIKYINETYGGQFIGNVSQKLYDKAMKQYYSGSEKFRKEQRLGQFLMNTLVPKACCPKVFYDTDAAAAAHLFYMLFVQPPKEGDDQ